MFDVDAEIYGVARQVHRGYRSYITLADLAQIGQVWRYEHKKRMEDLEAALAEEIITPQAARWSLRRDLRRAMELEARKAKAHWIGYDPSDEQFYGHASIELILPAVWFGEISPPTAFTGPVAGKSDPAEGNTWAARVQDVKGAWEGSHLTGREQAVLIYNVCYELPMTHVAELFNVDESTIRRWKAAALDKMVDFLGGPRPRGCPYDCECHEGRLRRRPKLHTNDSGANQMLG